MKDQTEEVFVSASILMECYKTNVGDHPWIKSNPEIAMSVEKAIRAMEEACLAISVELSKDKTEPSSTPRLTG